MRSNSFGTPISGRFSKIFVALVSAGATFANVAQAQGAATALEEVVVTAQKREQSMQDVPVSVSATNRPCSANGPTSTPARR